MNKILIKHCLIFSVGVSTVILYSYLKGKSFKYGRIHKFMEFKFAHIADSHIGGWRDQKLKDLSINAFDRAIDICITKKVDFVIIAGDLFNTALPGIEAMNLVTHKLFQLRQKNIPVYAVPGSHDFSPSGKTFLSTLEKAGLIINLAKIGLADDKVVLKPTFNEKTKTVLFGMLGRRTSLEKSYYKILSKEELEKDYGNYLFKIFVFHSAILELQPPDTYRIEAIPLSYLPKKFDYYAAGHVHKRSENHPDGYFIVYPGPLFPNSFSELEKFKHGGFYIVNVNVNEQTKEKDIRPEFQPIVVKNVYSISINANDKSASEINAELLDTIKQREFYDTLVLIRVYGELKSGKTGDINFKDLIKQIYAKGAFFVMKNTSMLKTKEFEGVDIDVKNQEEVEDKIIKENTKEFLNFNITESRALVKEMITLLDKEKAEGETNNTFELRISSEFNQLLNKLLNTKVKNT